MAVQHVTKTGILKAIEECDQLGEDEFLSKYGFGRPTKHFLVLDGQVYPSKAIVGVGHGYSGSGWRPLRWDQFSGGPETLRQLRKCGFGEFTNIRPNAPPSATSAETAEEDFDEGQRQKKERETLSRNPALVARAKEHYGYVCQACGFDFEKFYGQHGRQYIECHHLNPLAEREEVKPTKLEDVTVLCSNCHRMVHRQSPALEVVALKAMIEKVRSS